VAEREASRRWLRERYWIAEEESILFFNGAFRYSPNLEALEYILERINPMLQERGLRYRILICGRDIPEETSGGGEAGGRGVSDEAMRGGRYPNVIFAGFVEDIERYFMGADVFLNPVISGGGIKTKLVEALGNNLTAVSVRNGATGIDPALCGGKLLVCEDGDWEGFTELVIKALAVKGDIPPLFFEHFYWGNIAEKVVAFID
jgi:glycosyltransferase involved in cell wall biosynthesis